MTAHFPVGNMRLAPKGKLRIVRSDLLCKLEFWEGDFDNIDAAKKRLETCKDDQHMTRYSVYNDNGEIVLQGEGKK